MLTADNLDGVQQVSTSMPCIVLAISLEWGWTGVERATTDNVVVTLLPTRDAAPGVVGTDHMYR